jgi:uncharacterized protein (DUF4213/DUF364 family)
MTQNPNALYELLIAHANSTAKVTGVCLGQVWTFCKAENQDVPYFGLAMSPPQTSRTLSFPGTLVGKTIKELAGWVTDWESCKATIGMAAINCSLNMQAFLEQATPLASGNLAVFEHFLPQLQKKKVVVIGRYPGIEVYQKQLDLVILERQPQTGDYPDPACEFLLPQADWVFISGSSIPNKTFPRLAELSQHATTVLMGPTVPWLPELAEFGINYLAGVKVQDKASLEQTISEGGGIRIFAQAVRYHLAKLE